MEKMTKKSDKYPFFNQILTQNIFFLTFMKVFCIKKHSQVSVFLYAYVRYYAKFSSTTELSINT